MKQLTLKKHLHEQDNHQESSAWIHQGKAMLKLPAFYSEVTGLVKEGRADMVYLGLSPLSPIKSSYRS